MSKGFYIEGHDDPKGIKSKLEGSKVKCDTLFPNGVHFPVIKKGDEHEINIVNAYYEYDDFGILWNLDIVYYDDMIPNVTITDVDVIEDFCSQIEGQKTIEKLKEEYVITDEEINEALEEQAIWDVIDYLEERLEELEEMMEEGPLPNDLRSEYYEKNKQINELLDIVDDSEDDSEDN